MNKFLIILSTLTTIALSQTVLASRGPIVNIINHTAETIPSSDTGMFYVHETHDYVNGQRMSWKGGYGIQGNATTINLSDRNNLIFEPETTLILEISTHQQNDLSCSTQLAKRLNQFKNAKELTITITAKINKGSLPIAHCEVQSN